MPPSVRTTRVKHTAKLYIAHAPPKPQPTTKQNTNPDLLLELSLSLPYADYQRAVDLLLAAADHDRDGALSAAEFLSLYKVLCLARRAFKRQDHHGNGHIDRCDFGAMLADLGVLERPAAAAGGGSGSGGGGNGAGAAEAAAAAGGGEQQQQQQQQRRHWRRVGWLPHAPQRPSPPPQQQQQQQPQQQGRRPANGRAARGASPPPDDAPPPSARDLAGERGFDAADRAGRGAVNFSDAVFWLALYLHARGGVPRPDANGDVALAPGGLALGGRAAPAAGAAAVVAGAVAPAPAAPAAAAGD